MIGVVWICTLVSLIAIFSVLYFRHREKRDGGVVKI